MAFQLTRARASFIAARNIAGMFLETRTTVEYVVTRANLESSLAAMEDVQISFISNVNHCGKCTKKCAPGVRFQMEHVGMLKCI
jgi:hypothetical protein